MCKLLTLSLGSCVPKGYYINTIFILIIVPLAGCQASQSNLIYDTAELSRKHTMHVPVPALQASTAIPSHSHLSMGTHVAVSSVDFELTLNLSRLVGSEQKAPFSADLATTFTY
jgi:hypothetical protein